nr:synaptobrevin, longin-like domain protein [Tanacetum cinerariifolium]
MSSLFADTHNVIAILEKSDAAEGFEQIIDFLSGSYIHYALTVSPPIYISCIKQFWNSVSVKRSGDVTSQWKFLIHTILQSLSAKRTSWNEFSTAMASTVICLSKGQRFNFSKYIFDNLVPAQGDNVQEPAAKEVVPEVLATCSALAFRFEGLKNDKAAQQLDIVKLKARDEGIELGADQEKDAEVEGRHADKQAEIYNIDLDHSSKVLSKQEDDTEVQEAVEIVTTAKLMTEVVTAAATQ